MKADINHLKLTFGDIKNLVCRSKKMLVGTCLLCSLLGGSYFLFKSPQYYSEASFREKSKSQVETSKSLSLAMIIGGMDKNENAALTLMKSRTLLIQVIGDQGLQVSISQGSGLISLLCNVQTNTLAELSYWLPFYTPILRPQDTLDVVEVLYPGHEPLKVTLKFTSPQHYTLYDTSGKELGKGSIGQKFSSDSVSFALLPQNTHPQTGSVWKLTFQPMNRTLEAVKRKLTVNTDLQDKSLIRLSFYHPHPEKGAAFLNQLMSRYVEFMKLEHSTQAKEQLSYLRRRQEEIAADLKNVMEDYAQALAANVTSIESLAQLQESYTQRALLIDLELKRLNKVLETSMAQYDHYPNGLDSSALNHWLADLRAQKEQADTLRAVLEPLPAVEKAAEFEGMDVATADKLFTDYSKILGEIDVNLSHYQFIKRQIQDPAIELSSLSSQLEDPASQKIIHKAIELDVQKLDSVNRSQKEIDRIKEDLALQRKYLLNHIDQEIQLLSLKQEKFYSKLKSLQLTRLDQIQQRNAVLKQQIGDYLERRMHDFRHEKNTLAEQQQYIQSQMQQMPHKWASEKLMDMHLEMSGKMVEEITKLVETKNISSHIDTTQSSPLDKALAPQKPSNPYILLMTFVGGLFGAMISFCMVSAKGIYRQLPPSESLLKQLDVPVLGSLDHADGDFICRVIGWLQACKLQQKNTQIALLMLNKGADYSHQLAQMMAEQGLKVALTAFEKMEKADLCGVPSPAYQFQPRTGYDYLDIKTSSEAHSLAIISNPLQAFLDMHRDRYDWILIVSTASPCSYEAAKMLLYSDCAIATLCEESMQQIAAALNQLPQHPLAVVFDRESPI